MIPAIEHISKQCIKLELPSHTFPPFSHTNSYILLDSGQAALVDPGFYQKESLEIIFQALESSVAALKAILLTHTHRDHQEGINLLQNHFGNVPVFVHELEKTRVLGSNVQVLNSRFSLGPLSLEVLHTPGHSPGHVSFYLPHDQLLLVGDLVAGFGSTWIGVPEGNYEDYFRSLEKSATLKLKLLAPGHGPIIDTPYQKLQDAHQHRQQRLEQVFKALIMPRNLEQLCQYIYPEVAPELKSAAQSSLQALLLKLEQDQRVISHKGYYQQNSTP